MTGDSHRYNPDRFADPVWRMSVIEPHIRFSLPGIFRFTIVCDFGLFQLYDSGQITSVVSSIRTKHVSELPAMPGRDDDTQVKSSLSSYMDDFTSRSPIRLE